MEMPNKAEVETRKSQLTEAKGALERARDRLDETNRQIIAMHRVLQEAKTPSARLRSGIHADRVKGRALTAQAVSFPGTRPPPRKLPGSRQYQVSRNSCIGTDPCPMISIARERGSKP